jgi:glycosyltransferase involved in cell wall biosynthesis
MAKVLEYAGYWLFDAWVASRLVGIQAEVVIAYENAARETFKMAKRLGMVTVLDAASIHHMAQDRLHEFSESARFHRKVVMRKDEEIAYADYIVTCSDMARETYIEAGIPPERVYTIGLGTDVNFFTPGEGNTRSGRNGFSFLFVGESSPHKGVDVLLRAFDRVAQRHRGTHLRLVGPPGEQHRLLDRTDKRAIQIAGRKSHAELLEEYRWAQCMVLPSRQDAYGLVVAEALACGVPVIVSDMVGAKELIREGTNGWVLPANDFEALATRMMWCVEHPDVLYSMRMDARASAVVARWERYHEQLVAFVLSLRRR